MYFDIEKIYKQIGFIKLQPDFKDSYKISEMNKKYLSIGAGVAMAVSMASCGSESKTTVTADEQKEEAKVVPGFDISSLDTTVHACTDFYEYMAGGWKANNPIPETEGRWGHMNIMFEENQKKIKGIFEQLLTQENLVKGSDAQLIGDYYTSGMDTNAIEEAGLQYIQPLLDEVNAVSTTADLVPMWVNQDFKGVSKPVGAYVSMDSKNSTMNVLYFSGGGIGMPDRDYYLKDDSVSVDIQNAYKAFMQQIFVLGGNSEEVAKTKVETVYNLEKQMASNMYTRVERRDPQLTYNKLSKQEMVDLMKNVDLNVFFDGVGVSFDSIIVSKPSLVEAIDGLLASESIDTWKAYSEYRVLTSYTGSLPKEFSQASFDFYSTKLRGVKEMKPRWQRVMSSMNGLSEQIGHLYADKYFPQSSKEYVEKMVEDLRNVYIERVQGLEWMSSTTKEKAVGKLKAFTYKIGYPDKWKDYSDLNISKDSYLQNKMNLAEYLTKENFAKLGKPVDKSEWGMGAHIVNAYYHPLNNEVVFPAGILQPPFFNPNADDAINYGAIGGVIGHEFTHGFDDKGSLYDAEGNMNDWWTEEDRAAFDKLVQGVIEQYNGYEVLPGVHVNGALTVGENIADFGGITLAYHAYVKSLNGQEPALIDGFSGKQRVFLGWSQVWQMNCKDEYLRNQVMTDPHSPAKFRVIGPFSNMQEFEDNWGCNDSSAMMRAPEDRIVIW